RKMPGGLTCGVPVGVVFTAHNWARPPAPSPHAQHTPSPPHLHPPRAQLSAPPPPPPPPPPGPPPRLAAPLRRVPRLPHRPPRPPPEPQRRCRPLRPHGTHRRPPGGRGQTTRSGRQRGHGHGPHDRRGDRPPIRPMERQTQPPEPGELHPGLHQEHEGGRGADP